MGKELTYALITPYSLLKSRTGGIISRILSLSDLDLVGARMYTPGDEFLDEYCKTIEKQEIKPLWKKALIEYVNDKLRKSNKLGISNRTMFLLFEGDDAINVLQNKVIGPISDHLKGDTIRGTYGDCIKFDDGIVEYFEPAVLTSTDPTTNINQLDLFAKYALSDGGVLENVISFDKNEKPETSLVIFKPFEKQDPRPGNIVDMISRTGFFMVGIKLINMSVKQAEEIYKPVKDMFTDKFDEKFKPNLIEKLKTALNKQDVPFELNDDIMQKLVDQLKEPTVTGEFNKIVRYMTGHELSGFVDTEKAKEGKKTICFALLYQGINAISTIRELLGATDPKKADHSSIRRFYGEDILRNAVHASDSIENAERERKIIGLWKDEKTCDIKEIIERYTNSNVEYSKI
ncbi:MAG: nucleoside diphosphate kinase 4 [Candidatus Scalindua rubra]|uniref:Nucleoside diphosphate kinase n=1 Tax=Candidatus Scalindua rubra TaxID=1872076 RepID=A0A1E3XGE9_9BACT|nr:MAG: nucleoside diphosphate kinase 4 [Candidatus Scalindua rubra]